MTEYKKGDMVVVELDYDDAEGLNGGKDIATYYEQVLGKLEDFQPVEEKIKFTPEEKKEFDHLKGEKLTLYLALKKINQSDYPFLFQRMWNVLPRVGKNKVQVEFAIAWEKPSRIVVIEPEKYEVELDNGTYLQKDNNGIYAINGDAIYEFTLDEVKEAEKQLGIQGLQAKWHKAAKGETK
ncbi:MAG: hypothetical protein ABF470_00330 [Liquorilactobacillus sp.]|uniref:hypothetical protein n=1 Tax=Liquorilactobacillus TaxID=2767888 RepID=UPI0039EB6CAE